MLKVLEAVVLVVIVLALVYFGATAVEEQLKLAAV